MAFTLRITDVLKTCGEVAIVGKLEGGRFFGPERIAIPLMNGGVFNSCIGSMEAENPRGWPMLPEHGSVLTLFLQETIDPSQLKIGELAEGLGAITLNEPVPKLSNELLEHPEFWGCHIQLSLGTEEEEGSELVEALFNLSREKINDFYINTIEAEPCRSFSKALPDQRAIEVCYFDGVEYQTRYSMRLPDDEVILLGYQSGHCSLPALRWAEVLMLADAHGGITNPRSRAECLLLLIPSVYFAMDDPKDEVVEELKTAWTELGIIPHKNLNRLVENIIENVSNSVQWSHDSEHGWINDSGVSQRNPQSLLSELKPEHFQKIAAFFSGQIVSK